MARKSKSIKQTGKQNVVQTVKVVVAQPTRKRRGGGGRRRPPAQRAETISSHTMAPVFIQPPITSQTYPYPFEMGHRAGAVATEPVMKQAEVPKTLFEDLRPQAEPLRQPTADILAEKEIVEVVPKAEVAIPKAEVAIPKEFEERLATAEKMISSHKADVIRVMKKQAMFYEQQMYGREFVTPKRLPENPTTSVDSNHRVQESFGVFSDHQPLADTKMAPRSNEPVGIKPEHVVPDTNFTLDPKRDIAAQIMNEPFVKKEPAMSAQDAAEKITEAVSVRKAYNPRPSAELVSDFLNFPKDIKVVGNMSRETARAFIIDKQKQEGLTAQQFRKKYVDTENKKHYEVNLQ